MRVSQRGKHLENNFRVPPLRRCFVSFANSRLYIPIMHATAKPYTCETRRSEVSKYLVAHDAYKESTAIRFLEIR